MTASSPPFERLATEPRLSHEDLPRVNQRRQRAAIIPRRPAKSGSLARGLPHFPPVHPGVVRGARAAAGM